MKTSKPIALTEKNLMEPSGLEPLSYGPKSLMSK